MTEEKVTENKIRTGDQIEITDCAITGLEWKILYKKNNLQIMIFWGKQ